jgi:5'-3' exonuclease/transcription antitermination factor NusG
MTEWVVLELGPKAEGADPEHVRASIRHSIRDADVFIPASITKIGEERVIQYLVEGYAFVKRAHPDATYMRLENTKYVQTVLRHPVSLNRGRPIKQIAVISDAEIDKFRGQIRSEVDQGICVGDLVMITSGPYRQITARVENEILEQDAVQVFIKLRSKEAIITLPRACLRLVQKAERSPVMGRIDAVRAWFRGAYALLGWPEDISHVLLPYKTYTRLGNWLLSGQQRMRFIRAIERPFVLDFDSVQQRYKIYARLSDWSSRGRTIVLASREPPSITPLVDKSLQWERLSRWAYGKSLYAGLKAIYSLPPSPTLDARYIDWAWFQTVVERLDTLGRDIDNIEQRIRSGGKIGMPQNLIIDGTQLAIRCAMSPGLVELKDSTGRPTGGIFGFCQSLASLKKRYPSVTFWVTWDGSSQRRKNMFAGYKASRSDRSPMATFEIQYLRALLPKLGVFQAFNPVEEADDVIATLVRDRLCGQQNVILSTDRDLLQLVTPTDHQLVPAVGAGKEKIYTIESVTEEYGVGPDRILHVRALVGDTSDDIPGADGFGLKTASKLVKVYGTLERLFASNFAGLSQKQFNTLRAAEKQVRLNLELLKLQDDLVLTIVGPDPDQIAATERLREVDVKPDPLLAAFFHNASGLQAHA